MGTRCNNHPPCYDKELNADFPLSFPRRRESILCRHNDLGWIPAFAGMTNEGDYMTNDY